MPEWQTQTNSICTEFSHSNKLETSDSYLWRVAGKGTDGAWDPILSYFLIWMQLPGMCLVDFSKYLLVLGLSEPNWLWSGRYGVIKMEDYLLSATVACHVLFWFLFYVFFFYILWLQFSLVSGKSSQSPIPIPGRDGSQTQVIGSLLRLTDVSVSPRCLSTLEQLVP